MHPFWNDGYVKNSTATCNNPYNYKSGKIKAKLQLKETNSGWLRYAVDFPTAYPVYENKIAVVEYFQPRNVKKAPLAIVIHGWGDRSAIPCHLLARTLVKKGYAVFILYLVFHTSRMPETMVNHMPYPNAEDWFEGYRASVIEVRQIVDWASSRPELDTDRIAVLGISLGGFVSEIAMGLDKHIYGGRRQFGDNNLEH